MKSRITIEVDFEHGNKPIIQILHHNSEDVRDNLIKSFLQSFHNSGLCQIQWQLHEVDGLQKVFLRPLSGFNMPDLNQTNREQLEGFFTSGEVRGSSIAKYLPVK